MPLRLQEYKNIYLEKSVLESKDWLLGQSSSIIKLHPTISMILNLSFGYMLFHEIGLKTPRDGPMKKKPLENLNVYHLPQQD